MKILLGSHRFFPSTGGIETVTNLLAREFVRRGHEVRVITDSPGDGDFSYRVIRQPGLAELFRQISWCDIFLQNNISLRTLWPLIFVSRKLFIIHQTWIGGANEAAPLVNGLKRFVTRFAKSFAISSAVAKQLPADSIVVGNPYDDTVFRELPEISRTKDLVFVGRLVSDKGADVLIQSMSMLRASGVPVELTIVGDGPERLNLEKQVEAAALTGAVHFVGQKSGAALAKVLNEHRILVVPSLWAEPFGIVALEGIACGCVVVGSAAGGLLEAIGPCGVTFPNGDPRLLAEALENLLRDPERLRALRDGAQDHLAKYSAHHIASIYIERMQAARW